MPLLGSQGKHVQVAWGFEPAAGQMAATWYYLRAKSLKMLVDRPYEQDENQTPRGLKRKARNLLVRMPWEIALQPNIEDLPRILAHARGFASIATSAGFATWTLRDFTTGDSLASVIDTISIEGDRDDTYAQLNLNGVVQKVSTKLQNNKFVEMTLSGLSSQYTHQNDPAVVLLGATYTGKVHVRGRRSDPTSADAIKVKCVVAGALDGATAKVSFTKGATAYGATSYFVTAGQWMNVVLANNDPNGASGDPSEPMQVMFSSGGTLALNDEWSIAGKRTKRVATYPTVNPLHTVQAQMKVGGTSYVIENADISFTRPRVERRGCGTKFPEGFVDDGQQTHEITLQRRYTDRVLYELLQDGTPASFDCDIFGDKIGSTTQLERWRRLYPNVQVIKAGADATNDKSLSESITLRPFSDGSASDCTETIVTALSTLS